MENSIFHFFKDEHVIYLSEIRTVRIIPFYEKKASFWRQNNQKHPFTPSNKRQQTTNPKLLCDGSKPVISDGLVIIKNTYKTTQNTP
jgi:hypothetical protein